jgi:hypothetical protein
MKRDPLDQRADQIRVTDAGRRALAEDPTLSEDARKLLLVLCMREDEEEPHKRATSTGLRFAGRCIHGLAEGIAYVVGCAFDWLVLGR